MILQGPASTSDMSAQQPPAYGSKPPAHHGKKHRISAKRRKKFATVAGDKFPIPPGDKKHARAALMDINQAKPPLSADQKAKVRARARAVLKG